MTTATPQSEAPTPPQPQHGMQRLEAFFRPRGVAVLGASDAPGDLGRSVLLNLVAHGFTGGVHPVDPDHGSVIGLPTRPVIAEVPGPIDLAVIAAPAVRVPALVGECAAAGVSAAIVLSPGFAEVGEAGRAVQHELAATVARTGIRVLGPNCLGLISPRNGLNATYAPGMPQPGRIAFLSQSGGMCSAILDWSRRERFGFSAFVALGGMIDVGWSELLDWFASDPDTASILLAMESIGDPRAFLSAAREAALSKPVVVLKAGRTGAGALAARHHLGSSTGTDTVLDAAFRRAGVLRADSIEELFQLGELLAKQPRPRGRRLTIITNAGGPAVLASDALAQGGGELAPLPDDIVSRLDAVLPAQWSHANPIDLLGDADPQRYAQAFAIAGSNPASDGLLAILAPQEMSDPERTAQALKQHAAHARDCVLASWMGGPRVEWSRDLLSSAGIAGFPYPDAAARTFARLAAHGAALDELHEIPPADPPEDGAVARAVAAQAIANAQKEGTNALDETAARALLVAARVLVGDGTGAAAPTVALGMVCDRDFGPVLSVGAAGACDRAIALAPLTTLAARRLVERARLPVSVDAGRLAEALVALSRLACEVPRLAAIAIDDAQADGGGVHARLVSIDLHPAAIADEALPRPAIRPFPREYVTRCTARDGTSLLLRPIRPDDEPALVVFHKGLSDASVMGRYFKPLTVAERTAHERLVRICLGDYRRDLVLVAERVRPEDGVREVIAVGRLSRNRWANEAELAVVVVDRWQGQGIGSRLIAQLLTVARAERLDRVSCWLLPISFAMHHLVRKFGFTLNHVPGDPLALAELRLRPTVATPGRTATGVASPS